MSNGGAVVIGAGPAGLASAAELRRRGVPAVVLERADGVAASWRGRYDRLRLNSSRWFSKLPGGATRRVRGSSVARRGGPLPGGLRDRQRPRRAHEHRGAAHRSRRQGWVVRRRAPTSRPSRSSSRPATSTPRSSRTGPGASASAGRCCTPPSTATPSPSATATSSSSARAARAWRSPTTWPRAERGGSGSRSAPRRTCSLRSPMGPAFALALCGCAQERARPDRELRPFQGDRRPDRARPRCRGGDSAAAPPRRRAGDHRQGGRPRDRGPADEIVAGVESLHETGVGLAGGT